VLSEQHNLSLAKLNFLVRLLMNELLSENQDLCLVESLSSKGWKKRIACERREAILSGKLIAIELPVSFKAALWESARSSHRIHPVLLSVLRSHETIAQNSHLCIQSGSNNASVRLESIQKRDLRVHRDGPFPSPIGKNASIRPSRARKRRLKDRHTRMW